MGFLDEVRERRRSLAEVLSEYHGIRKLVEDLYPDRAHFIFELLQNAEDAHATDAAFALSAQGLAFEHDGRPFSEEDIWAITNIGEGTKSEDEDKIGRFGVGFKAVFAYSENPHIWSPTYSFKLTELVLPEDLPNRQKLNGKTRFEFPFNNPKKPPSTAYAEVEAGLAELAETTLLFLSHLKSITWRVEGHAIWQVVRIRHDGRHIEIQKRENDRTVDSWHFLRFTTPTRGLEKQSTSIAYALDLLPNVAKYSPQRPLAKQLKVVAASPGRVAVFFPAQKETSGLRFHVHAPFVPEVSRASVKETSANDPLFEQLSQLAANALVEIRDLSLLSTDFLGVLPNPSDPVPPRYHCIRQAIVDAMNSEALTPTHGRSFAPAKKLLQSRAALKELLCQQDIAFLLDGDGNTAQWAISAAQRNSPVDRFLAGLSIRIWDVDSFIKLLICQTSEKGANLGVSPWISKGPDPEFMSWLTTKSAEWHQQLYALLRSELLTCNDSKRRQLVERIRHLKIVRLSDGSYDTSCNCYFPSAGVDSDSVLPRVDKGLYQSGKSKSQQTEAYQFLEEIGVRPVGELEQLEAILKSRYEYESDLPDTTTYFRDLARFISLVEKEPTHASLFSQYYIFERATGDWGKPGEVYLDAPFLPTGLSLYYLNIDAAGDSRAALASIYTTSNIPVERVTRFAETLGVQKELTPISADCSNNPQWEALQAGSIRKRTNDQYRRHSEDYDIPEFEVLVKLQSLPASLLIWRTMTDTVKKKHLTATYRRNNESPLHTHYSQLIQRLLDVPWIPQNNGDFVRPTEALRELLPEGFTYDAGYEWLASIHFAEDEQARSSAHQAQVETAERLGFHDSATLERARQFAKLSPSEQEQILEAAAIRRSVELPENEPKNATRRATLVSERAEAALERLTEVRTRSVAVGRDDVKQQAGQYLCQQYSNADGDMFCQVCKTTLPFKLDDGSFYFEKVEFLPELAKRYYQNYIALCPNHSAMYKHANRSQNQLKAKFEKISGNHLEIVLAADDTTIYFTKTHIADLKQVIDVDDGQSCAEETTKSSDVSNVNNEAN